jgi:suppressor of fused
MADKDADGPGPAALRAHVEGIDGGPAVAQYFPRDPRRFDGGGPVHAVAVYRIDPAGGPPHWHLVTYGLSELFAKESPDKDVSGWGFELTLRLSRDDNDEAPAWASDLLANLAAYMWETGHQFARGDQVDLRGPIRIDSKSDITAAAVTTDPALATVRGPFGRVEFLQLIGLTADELELCRSWRTDAVVALLAEANPLGVIDLSRHSLLDDPATRQRAEAGVVVEGSSLDELRVATLGWKQRGRGARLYLQLGSGAAAAVGPALRRRLDRPGASFRVIGDAGQVTFAVGERAGWAVTGTAVTVEVPLDFVDDLAGVFTGTPGGAGVPALPGLHFVTVR